jgi:hypothetical protein
MTVLAALISLFDRLLLCAITAKDLDDREHELKRESNTHDTKIAKLIYDALDSIDTKATAVLQHVSIMIAVSGALYTKADSKAFQIIFISEMLVYVLMALLCLRLLMTQCVSSDFEASKDAVAKEAIMDLTSKLTFVVTLALVVSVIAEVWLI